MIWSANHTTNDAVACLCDGSTQWKTVEDLRSRSRGKFETFPDSWGPASTAKDPVVVGYLIKATKVVL
eukprot:4152932-Amphidinium_carterae.1